MKPFSIFLLLAALSSLSVSSQELQSSRKTVIFHHDGYWCADDYSPWAVGLYDTISSAQNTSAFPAYYVAFDADSVTAPMSQLVYKPAKNLAINVAPTWGNKPHMNVNFYGFLMDPYSYGGTTFPPHVYKRAYDTFAHYVTQQTFAPNVTAVGFTKTMLPNDSVVINTRVRFLSASSKQFRVAVYILEDSAMGYTNHGSGYSMKPHRYMLRYANMDYSWGMPMAASGPYATGQEVYGVVTKKIPASWNKSKLSYLMITYQYDSSSGRYFIDNATKGAIGTTPASIAADHHNAGIDVSVFPNPAKAVFYLNYNFPAESKGTNIVVTDMSGKNLGAVYSAPVNNKAGVLTLQLPSLRAGLYLLSLRNEFGTVEKIITVQD
jgi:hypothetical protein